MVLHFLTMNFQVMTLLTLRNITFSHGGLPLVEHANLSIKTKDRVCLIGRNGSGKSSLLKLILREFDPDEGSIDAKPGIKIGFLPQDVPNHLSGKIIDIVSQASHANDHEWEKNPKISAILSKLKLDPETEFNQLSGGSKRRVLLAKALVSEPDLLLLDEPTNHLDIDSIAWLEKFLLNYHRTLIMVTHDRTLMQNIADHIVEIDNGKLFTFKSTYREFLKQKETLLNAEATSNALFDKKLAEEEVWIRQGIKARRTRNEGRVRALEKMREQRRSRRIRPGQVAITQQSNELSGKIVFEINEISHAYNEKIIIKKFSSVIMRGDKIGIIGPNGCGKSTLLNVLLGHLTPLRGSVKQGTNLNVAYFDQQRLQLDENKTVLDNVCGGSTSITIGDQTKHCMSYLQDYLFNPSQARSLVKTLSGGERNRALIAKIFTQPANVLVLDEPTNDLDIETLELLEEQLVNYKGTLLLVSHDRTFLNNVVTSTIVMEGNGTVEEYVGGYDDWLRQRKEKVEKSVSSPIIQEKKQPEKGTSTKLSYKELRELQSLPKEIESLEQQQKILQQQLNDPSFYKINPDLISEVSKKLNVIDHQLEEKFFRWQDLESRNNR